jgi:hypothetical protein
MNYVSVILYDKIYYNKLLIVYIYINIYIYIYISSTLIAILCCKKENL